MPPSSAPYFNTWQAKFKEVIKMAYDEKAKQRTMKYMKEKRDKLTLNFPLGDKDRYKAYAESQGMSLTALIVKLLEEDIKRHE